MSALCAVLCTIAYGVAYGVIWVWLAGMIGAACGLLVAFYVNFDANRDNRPCFPRDDWVYLAWLTVGLCVGWPFLAVAVVREQLDHTYRSASDNDQLIRLLKHLTRSS